MTLKDYLIQFEHNNGAAFARKINVAPQTINKYLKGQRRPRAEIVARIKKATKGRVTAEDFYN